MTITPEPSTKPAPAAVLPEELALPPESPQGFWGCWMKLFQYFQLPPLQPINLSYRRALRERMDAATAHMHPQGPVKDALNRQQQRRQIRERRLETLQAALEEKPQRQTADAVAVADYQPADAVAVADYHATAAAQVRLKAAEHCRLLREQAFRKGATAAEEKAGFVAAEAVPQTADAVAVADFQAVAVAQVQINAAEHRRLLLEQDFQATAAARVQINAAEHRRLLLEQDFHATATAAKESAAVAGLPGFGGQPQQAVETSLNSEPSTLLNFLRAVLQRPELVDCLDQLKGTNAALYQMVREALGCLDDFGSDQLVAEALSSQPEACGALLALGFVRSLTLLQTLMVPFPGNPSGLLFGMHFADLQQSSMLSRGFKFTAEETAAFRNQLLAFYLETSCNTQLSGTLLERAVGLHQQRLSLPSAGSGPFRWPLMHQPFGETLRQPPVVGEPPLTGETRQVLSRLLLPQAQLPLYAWPENWETGNRGFNLLANHLCQQVFNNPEHLPTGLTTLDPREVRVLGKLLLVERSEALGLSDVLSLHTGWQSLLWGEGLHQAAAHLWLDQLAQLENPPSPESYGLSRFQRETLDAAVFREKSLEELKSADLTPCVICRKGRKPTGFGVTLKLRRSFKVAFKASLFPSKPFSSLST